MHADERRYTQGFEWIALEPYPRLSALICGSILNTNSNRTSPPLVFFATGFTPRQEAMARFLFLYCGASSCETESTTSFAQASCPASER